MKKPPKRVYEELRARGLSLNFLAATSEWRVNFRGGREATAYYTSDLDDAVRTAYSMAGERR